MPGCESPADRSIHCKQHQPELFNTPWSRRLAAFPAELREQDIWCNWIFEERGGKVTKRPLASSTDRSTWISFEEACRRADANTEFGVGVMCDGSHTFVDLDKCVVNGQIEAWAQAALLRLKSYAELSPSGTGIHSYVKGTVSKASKIDGCEIYSTARYFTVTGQHIAGTPLTIAEPSTDELEELRQDVADGSLRPKQESPKTTGVRISKIKYVPQAEREAKLARALSGDLSEYGDNRSDAIYGVMQLLARKHQGDEEAIAEEFEASELCAMWGSKWERLRDREIAKGVANWQENGSPKWEDDEDDQERPFVLKRFSQLEAKPVDWIWKGYLAAGKLSTFSGEPGHGKSLIALDIAARVTTGKDFPDGSKNTMAPSEVLLLTVEEDHEDTVLPRFLLAGGDASKLLAIYVGDRPGLFSVEQSGKQLRQIFMENPQIRLMVLDPMLDFVKAEQNKDADVRAALNGLADIASEYGFAVIGINHFNKKSDLDAIHRVAGSRGWTAVARINHIVGRTEDGIRHLCNLKTNIAREGSSLDFTVEERPLTAGKITCEEYPFVSWIGKGTATANDITANQRKKPKETPAVDVWLREFLADGEWHLSADLFAEGDELFNKQQIKRGLSRIEAEHEKRGMPAKVYWRLRVVSRPAEAVNDEDITFGGEAANA
jgi:hypothetical protein